MTPLQELDATPTPHLREGTELKRTFLQTYLRVSSRYEILSETANRRNRLLHVITIFPKKCL